MQLFEPIGEPVSIGPSYFPKALTLANGNTVIWWFNSVGTSRTNFQIYGPDGQKLGPMQTVALATEKVGLGATSDGGFGVAYNSGGDVGVMLFDSTGSRVNGVLTPPLSVNAFGPVDFVGFENGGFAYSWSNSDGLSLQICDRDGDFAGNPVYLGAKTSYPSLTLLADNTIAITYMTYSATGKAEIELRHFSNDGVEVGSPIRVNSVSQCSTPEVTALANGNIVVTWILTGSNGGVFAQVYDADFQAIGGNFRVSDTDLASQSGNQTVAIPSGGFAVAWEDRSHVGDWENVRTRFFSDTGVALGASVEVETRSGNWERQTGLAVLNSSEILVVYNSTGQYDFGGNNFRLIAYPDIGTEQGDTIVVETNHRLAGLDGNDVLIGSGSEDLLDGGGGDDLLRGGAGADQLIGGAGNDTADYSDNTAGLVISLGSGSSDGDIFSSIENVVGSHGDDLISGTAIANRLSGGAGNDQIRGAAGDDLLFGEDGDDLLDGGAGSDRIDGGDGIDTASYAGASAGVIVSIAIARAQDTVGSGIDTLLSIENLEGSLFADTLRGSGADNVLYGLAGEDLLIGNNGNDTLFGGDGVDRLMGNAGNDTLHGDAGNDLLLGGAGNDRLFGGSGNDRLDGGVGADRMEGGTGDDVYVVENAADIVIELAGEGVDTVRSNGIDVVLGANIERLIIASGSASGTGNGLANVMTGSNGNNLLSGMGGNDVIKGLLGTDTLDGGDGDDWLYGGLARDTLTGGAGADRFFFDTLSDSSSGPVNADVITDFSHAEGDRIGLAPIDAISGTAGNDAFAFIGSAAFSHTAGELRYRYDGNGNTIVQVDVNGDAVSDMSIVLTGEHALVAGDFIL